MAGQNTDSGLESLLEESLQQTPHFEDFSLSDTASGEKSTLLQIAEKMPWVTAAATALLSVPGNPAYTWPLTGAIAYVATRAATSSLENESRLKKRNVRNPASSPKAGVDYYNHIFYFNPFIAMTSGATAFLVGMASPAANLATASAFAIINSAGAYATLSGMEKLLHSESLATVYHKALCKLQPRKTVRHLERIAAMPHSKEKESVALLQLGDAYMLQGQPSEALNTYKRLLKSAVCKDGLTGISDWLVGTVSVSYYQGSNEPYGNVQKAMHDFLAGNPVAAHEALTRAVAAEPKNRQLRRLRALFYEATGNDKESNLEMRVRDRLLELDTTAAFRAVGESRNEVLVDPEGDSYRKRSKDKTSLEEEVTNIEAFSSKLPGMLPRVLGLDFDGVYHCLKIESMGAVTMLDKAKSGNLQYSDVKAVLALLVRVIAAGNELRNEGRIKVREPIDEETYAYLADEQLRAGGWSPVQPNTADKDGQKYVFYFANRLTDLFFFRVQQSNRVSFSEEFRDKILKGAGYLNLQLLNDRTINMPYSDFTQRNIIFDSLSGNLAGKIDWESLKILPVTYELVNILEFYGPNIAMGSQVNLLEHFIGSLEKALNITVNKKAFMFDYRVAAVQRHLELIGYRSRDTATNPENIEAQVYHLLMARTHLQNIIPDFKGEAKTALEEMLQQLEDNPILKSKAQQEEIEARVRQGIHTTFRSATYGITKEAYWLDVAKIFAPKNLVTTLQQQPKTQTQGKFDWLAPAAGIAFSGSALLAATAGWSYASYLLMEKIMPSIR